MTRIALVVAIAALLVAGLAGAYALSVSNRLEDAEQAAAQADARVEELSNRLEDAELAVADAAQISDRLDDVETVATHVAELDECMPEILDLIYTMQGDTSFGSGIVYVYPSTNLSRRCSDILSYAVGD